MFERFDAVWVGLSLFFPYPTMIAATIVLKASIPRWWSWLVSWRGESTWSSVDLFPRLARPVGSSMMNNAKDKKESPRNSPKWLQARLVLVKLRWSILLAVWIKCLEGNTRSSSTGGKLECGSVSLSLEPMNQQDHERTKIMILYYINIKVYSLLYCLKSFHVANRTACQNIWNEHFFRSRICWIIHPSYLILTYIDLCKLSYCKYPQALVIWHVAQWYRSLSFNAANGWGPCNSATRNSGE